ncbi:MAG: cytochrome c, partial [Rhodobacteraceae bacterium]|nr:cytochrome c [Paracoccaceae bacterium]
LAAAAGTDQDSLKAAMGGVGAACGACHKAYRKAD